MENTNLMTYDYERRIGGKTGRVWSNAFSDNERLMVIRLYARAVWSDVCYFDRSENIDTMSIVNTFTEKLKGLWAQFFSDAGQLHIEVTGFDSTHLKFTFQTDTVKGNLYRGYVERYPLSPTMTAIKRNWAGYEVRMKPNPRYLSILRVTDGTKLALRGWAKSSEERGETYAKLEALVELYYAGYRGPYGKYFAPVNINLPIDAPTSEIVNCAITKLEERLAGCHVLHVKSVRNNAHSVTVDFRNGSNFTSFVRYTGAEAVKLKAMLEEVDVEVIKELVLVYPADVRGKDTKTLFLELLELNRLFQGSFDVDVDTGE